MYIFSASRFSNEIVNRLIKEARVLGPRDPLTISAYMLNGILRLAILLPSIVLVPIFTLVLGLLVTISFGTLLMLFSAIWLPFLGIILGSSWLWLKIPILRPILLIPSVIIAVVTFFYVSLIPDMGEKYQKVLKLGICDSWPYSYLVWRLNLKEGQPEEPL